MSGYCVRNDRKGFHSADDATQCGIEEHYWDSADGPPPEPVRDYLTEAATETARLRADASYAITPLQYAVDVDDATTAELALLKSWKKYVVVLNRLPDQAGYPETISWPATPE